MKLKALFRGLLKPSDHEKTRPMLHTCGQKWASTV